ncbi:MAG: glycosyltransferase family 2 protein, partial [Acidimicrobiales bacterium]
MAELVRQSTPSTAAVLVVSKGNDELLALGDRRRAWHFPGDERGAYAWFYPADSGSAVVQLEAHRSRGSEFLALPSTASWWLDHYSGLRRHLERHYRLVASDGGAAIFDLRHRARGGGGVIAQMAQVLADFESCHDRLPVILDWDSGIDLTTAFPEHTVFSPPGPCAALPYLEASLDIVVRPTGTRAGAMAEARRVASGAVVTRRNGRLEVEPARAALTATKTAATVSIVVPVYNGAVHTRACLIALLETLPRDRDVEAVLVDDASTDR